MEDKSPQKGKKLGVGRKLNKEQEAEIFNLITRKRPFQLGFKLPYKKVMPYLWSRNLLMQLIMRKFEVRLTDGGVVNYLTRWGFPPLNSPLKMSDRIHVQCTKVIREWFDIYQEAMIARSKDEKAKIYWMYEIASVGLLSSDTSRRSRLTMIPVIENQGRVHWLTVRGLFTKERQLMLLKSLVGQTNSKVFLIRNTEVHFKSPLVVTWLNENKSAIEIFPPPEWEVNS